ncbi:sugar kinase [Ammoniphilus sp. 3BR4]|uniref:sugar kinase n=1 Tax=Ammoniphilus sp. 3BR4 TaxID=3158265 RepID=UPI0034672990
MAELVTLGETMMVLTPPDQYGRIKTSGLLAKAIAGAESNVAIGVARLKHSAAWISRVGNDPFGEEILYRLNGERIDTSRVKIDPSAGTGIFFKERGRGGNFQVHYYRKLSAASFLSKDDIDEDVIRQAKILHLTGITPALSSSCHDAVQFAIAMAKKHSVKISFDPNLRLKLWTAEAARETLLPIIRQADWFFPGVEEARLLLNRESIEPDQLISAFLDMGVPQVILKLGPKGCMTANRDERVFVKGFQVDEIDPLGAGDGFCAGYLAGVLKGWEPGECAELANVAGALAVTGIGDYEALPTFEEVEQFLGRKSLVSR